MKIEILYQAMGATLLWGGASTALVFYGSKAIMFFVSFLRNYREFKDWRFNQRYGIDYDNNQTIEKQRTRIVELKQELEKQRIRIAKLKQELEKEKKRKAILKA